MPIIVTTPSYGSTPGSTEPTVATATTEGSAASLTHTDGEPRPGFLHRFSKHPAINFLSGSKFQEAGGAMVCFGVLALLFATGYGAPVAIFAIALIVVGGLLASASTVSSAARQANSATGPCEVLTDTVGDIAGSFFNIIFGAILVIPRACG